MAIFDIFSKRNKKPNEIFIYDKLPMNFRVQVVHILVDSLGKYNPPNMWGEGGLPSNKSWEFMNKLLCKEYGIFQLSEKGSNPAEKCIYFIQEAKMEQVFDLIEFSFRFMQVAVSKMSSYGISRSGITQSADSAIIELNERFKEHGIGYQYIGGKIVRVDSDYIYSEAVKPAVNLLFSEGFEGASEEFLRAHEHNTYSHKDNRQKFIGLLIGYSPNRGFTTIKIFARSLRLIKKTGNEDDPQSLFKVPIFCCYNAS